MYRFPCASEATPRGLFSPAPVAGAPFPAVDTDSPFPARSVMSYGEDPDTYLATSFPVSDRYRLVPELDSPCGSFSSADVAAPPSPMSPVVTDWPLLVPVEAASIWIRLLPESAMYTFPTVPNEATPAGSFRSDEVACWLSPPVPQDPVSLPAIV